MSVRVVNLNGCNSIADAFEKSECMYSVEQAEIMNSANLSVIPGKKVLYRGDTGQSLGVVGMNYGLIQNSEAFAFFDILIQNQKAEVTKVVELNGGQKITIFAEAKNIAFDARPGDQVGLQYRLRNSFDGSGGEISFHALRLVCKNGLTRSDEIKNKISFHHSKNIKQRLEEALTVIARGENWLNHFKEISTHLTQKIIDKQSVKSFLDELFGEKSDKKKELVTNLFEHGQGNGQGTAWDLYNGVTEYIDHYSRYTKSVVDDLKTSEYSVYGNGSFIKERALDLLLK